MKLKGQVIGSAVAVFALALFALLLSDRGEVRRVLPQALGELSLKELLEGRAPRDMIDRLHEKSVSPGENYIGRYQGNGGEATIYLSVYEAEEDVKTAYRQMASLIEAGNPMFDHYMVVQIDGKDVSMCLGQGQAHFFFAHRTSLYWLAVDVPLAQQTIQQLVRVLAR